MRMKLRRYEASDCKETRDLFYNTVHFVNSKDYSKKELDAWARKEVDLEDWNESLSNNYCVVATENEVIVGFGDINKEGYLDHLFVHKDYQRMRIGSCICEALEKSIRGKIITQSSITALPFFLKRGYKIIKEQRIIRKGTILTNYLMEKER